jgi:ribonucleoside-diphosphate reductase alpha chain
MIGIKEESMGIKIRTLDYTENVYDITVPETSNFFANGILVHNCAEIDLPTKPLDDINDDEGEIALCTLSATNWGNISDPSEFEEICDLTVRALDALLDYQAYPVKAAYIATMGRRPLGVGINNLAYWLAKNGYTYQGITKEGLAHLHEWLEAWSYYLIKASITLAEEKGSCKWSDQTKYQKGLFPVDTYKKAVDTLTPNALKLDWDSLRERCKVSGIRNSTLMAIMPSETSSQVINATNGIEPPRSLVSVKASKDGILKQVVPEIRKLKNKYDLLWDQKSPEGYMKICSVIQKFVDQGISVNTSYNPAHFRDEKIPMSTLLQGLLMFYKFGGKQLYYFNTHDGQGEVEYIEPVTEGISPDEEDCESCIL